MTYRIAIVTPDLSQGGGVGRKTEFLYRLLQNSGVYEPDIISLATSSSDSASVHLTDPLGWIKGVQVTHASWQNLNYLHVGALFSEVEYQRYRPRKTLTDVLRGYDLVQFVAGTPPWVCVAADVDRPTLLWTATTARADREDQVRKASLWRRAWSTVMLPITESYERRALKVADWVFALSEYTRANIEPIAGAHKVTLAPCGVDTDLFCPSSKPAGDYILCVARLSDPRKNLRVLSEAYAMLQRTVANLPELYLVGDRLSASDSVFLDNLRMAHKVRQIGKIGVTELAELYQKRTFLCALVQRRGARYRNSGSDGERARCY